MSAMRLADGAGNGIGCYPHVTLNPIGVLRPPSRMYMVPDLSLQGIRCYLKDVVLLQKLSGRPPRKGSSDGILHMNVASEGTEVCAILMAKLSAYDLDILSKVPTHDTYLDNQVIDQSVQEMQYYEQPIFDNDTYIDLTTENALMSVTKEMSNQVAKCNDVDKVNKTVNESLTVELERYKEQINLFEERHKFDLNDREKYIDGQLRKVIVDKIAKVADFKNQIHSLTLQLNATIESHKTLSTMVDVLKMKSKAKEDKFLQEIIELEKKKKALDNMHIICQDVMSIVMHADVESKNVSPANNNSVEYDNLEAELLKKENDRLLELIISQDLMHIAVNTLATIANHVISSTSASESKPPDNTKKNRISRPTSSNKKNKVEDHLRSVRSSFNKKNRIFEPVCNANVMHYVLNVNSELVCSTCNECMFDAIHDLCVVDYLNNVNELVKFRSAKRKKKKNWKPTSKVFTSVGYWWLSIGQTFIIDGTKCPMTRITSTLIVPSKETSQTPVIISNPEIKVYRRRTKLSKSVVQIILWNDHVAAIIGYGDYQIGNVMISRVYYMEGLGHNLFSLEAVVTACYTQNRSLIRKRQNNTPYELLHDKKPDLTYFHVFGALCYPANGSEDLGKLKPKADIGIFV
ncbi:retrovirus-related pol polyprotein from transposon TNT 1-94 [Tanacetum coccineum]